MKKLLFAILLFARVSFAQTCDTSLLPVVFVHGFMGSGDNWALQVQRFSSNGFCEDRLFTFDWNSIGGGAGTGQRLDSFINTVLQKTGATKVNLVGHSAGGSVCYNYLSDSAHAAKVARYVHVGSSRMRSPAGKKGEVPTMNIYSTDDQVMKGGGEITGAENVKQSGNDHMQVATSAASFSAMLGFFTGEKQRDIRPVIPEPGKEIFMGGKAVIMAENTPMAMDSFRVNLLDTRTGRLIKDKRAKAGGDYLGWTSFASDGSFGFNLCKACAAEIEIHPAKGRNLFYYFEPLVRNNGHVYLRGLPNGGPAAAMLGNIPNDDRQAVLVIFTSNNAVIAGRDSLAIDSIPLSLPSLMPAGRTSIACFVYDDGDQKTSGQPLASLSKAPFISGVDVYIKPETGRGMHVYYNGRTIVLPKRKSNEGIMVLVLN